MEGIIHARGNFNNMDSAVSSGTSAKLQEEEITIVTLAADQRVQRWRVVPEKVTQSVTLSSPLAKNCPLQWQSGVVTNITDPQFLSKGDSCGKVLVAGEGAQTLLYL